MTWVDEYIRRMDEDLAQKIASVHREMHEDRAEARREQAAAKKLAEATRETEHGLKVEE
jgi:hypothetical protein